MKEEGRRIWRWEGKKGGPARMEVVGESAKAERKKSSEGFIELGKGRKNPRKGKRHSYPWISEPGWKDRLNRFNFANGYKLQGKQCLTVQSKQLTQFLRPNTER
ncbi:hypothetical protein HAX54_046548 [Datura stramonium]|uniref:Uncharacterized protein n=1 Tax=Datura stramonium TaxID=4076 RepID=A0ABS8WJP2_DATST|nr:hypothetical protein [Datura stramonium]